MQYDTFKVCLFSQTRLHYLSSQIQKKLLERVKKLQLLLAEFKRQV